MFPFPHLTFTISLFFCRLKQEVGALDEHSRAISKFSVREQQQQRSGGQDLQDEDSSCASGAMNHLDEASTVSFGENNEQQQQPQQRTRALSFPSDSSLAASTAMTPSREELSERSSFIEPLQESPLRGALGRDTYRISPRYSSSLTHLTSNTQTTLLTDHERQNKVPAFSSHGAGGESTGAAEVTGAHSLFDIMSMDFASELPSPSS